MRPPRSSRGVFGVPRRRFRHFQPLLGVIRGVGFHLARVPRSLGSHGSSMRNQKTGGTPEEKKRKKKTTMNISRFVPGGKENMGTPEVFSWEKKKKTPGNPRVCFSKTRRLMGKEQNSVERNHSSVQIRRVLMFWERTMQPSRKDEF